MDDGFDFRAEGTIANQQKSRARLSPDHVSGDFHKESMVFQFDEPADVTDDIGIGRNTQFSSHRAWIHSLFERTKVDSRRT
jgi:hypothetical protein